jgi:hypothetical protein
MTESTQVVRPEQQRVDGSGDALPEIRCRRCQRLLMKGEIRQVEIKFPKCGCVQTLRLNCF